VTESRPTVREALGSGTARLKESGSESARLDAELLLAHAVGIDRTGILAHPEAPLGPAQLATYEQGIERRGRGEPVAYIRGLKEFYGLSFGVDARALIPRPETERLVELALERITEMATATARPVETPKLRVIDLGTGSGAVIVAIAATLRRRRLAGEIEFTATDRSADSLRLAVENAVAHGVADIVRFQVADLLDPALVAAGRFDLVVANLPYIPSADVPGLPIAASFEPVGALDGGSDGLELIRRLISQLARGLAPGGTALIEIGAGQSDAVLAAVAAELPGWPTSVQPDLGGIPRVVRVDRRLPA